MTEGTTFRLKKAQNNKKKPRHGNNSRQLLLMTTHWTFIMNERLHTRATANWLHPLPLLNCILSYRSLTTKERPSSQFQSRDSSCDIAFSALTLLVGWQEGHPACKKTEWWGAGVVVYLEQGADLHMAQLMPLPLTVSRFSKIQIDFTFLVPAHPGSPGKRAVKRACVCV